MEMVMLLVAEGVELRNESNIEKLSLRDLCDAVREHSNSHLSNSLYVQFSETLFFLLPLTAVLRARYAREAAAAEHLRHYPPELRRAQGAELVGHPAVREALSRGERALGGLHPQVRFPLFI
jgi:hypothetical protein